MSNQIPGVPEGWVIDHIGKPIFNVDWVIGFDGQPMLCDYDSSYLNRVIIRKIEKPAKYRPFANCVEVEPFFDRKLRWKNGTAGLLSISIADNGGIFIGTANYTFQRAFDVLVLDDGTPFGVRIDE